MEEGADMKILVISEHTNLGKIERHIGPLADISAEVKMICLTPNENVDIKYNVVPTFGIRLIGIGLMFLYALREVLLTDYNLVVSLSLIPYGFMSLVAGTVSRTPTHLGILGADLDVHAHAWYRAIPRFAFQMFDSLFVLGSRHRNQLIEYGVNPSAVFILTNAVDTTVYNRTHRVSESKYDFVWSGRLSPEKAPLLFVESVAELDRRGHNIQAAIVGAGKLSQAVDETIHSYSLTDVIHCPGWVDEPANYYAKSDTFVLTSEREALGLALIESMAMGLACVAPPIGNIPDIAADGENALLVDDRTPGAFADAMERILTDEDLRARLGENAIAVGQSFSYQNARDDWREIIEYTTRQ